jgi:hypothetical protein
VHECADCEAGSYSVKGTGVNAERGMTHGSSTFKKSKSLGSNVHGWNRRDLACRRLGLGLAMNGLHGNPFGTARPGEHVTQQLDICLCLSRAQPDAGLRLQWKIHEIMKLN